MNKPSGNDQDEMRAEYDLGELSGRVRGKHYEATKAGTNLVLLDPDVAEEFPDAESVNKALRELAKVRRDKGKDASGTKGA